MNKKVVLVTGASRGIGREIARMLAVEGNIVIANYCRSENKALELQNELQKLGHKIDIFQADVSKREEVKKMIEFVIHQYGKIDVLVNNAGVDQVKLFTEITDDDWDYIMENNLYSVFYCTQEAVRYMIHEKSGCIINISSIFGKVGGACEVHYSVTKAAIDGMTKALAKEIRIVEYTS